MDIAMPVLNGLEATRKIRTKFPNTQVAVLTMYDSDPLIRQAVEAGARAYILKANASLDLVTAVEAVSEGHSLFSSKVLNAIMNQYYSRRSVSE
jgi:DNA-binding NarL/FixJ family response regulator